MATETDRVAEISHLTLEGYVPNPPRYDYERIMTSRTWRYRILRKAGSKCRTINMDHTAEEIAKGLLVCMGYKLDGKTTREYSLFSSFIEYYNFVQLIPPKLRIFYEVIMGNLPQKPRFDLDIHDTENLDQIGGETICYLIRACITVMARINVEFDLDKNLMIFSSHDDKVRSFHVVINGYYHENNEEALAFYERVKNEFSILSGGKYLQYLDRSVYKSLQQFRIYGSQKHGSNRPKVLIKSFVFDGKNYTHKLDYSTGDEEFDILRESLITFVADCKLLPALTVDKHVGYEKRLILQGDLQDGDVADCMKLLDAKMPGHPFSVREVKGYLISLKRSSPSFCPTCGRSHQSENPYIYVIDGKVYWDCRRCDRGVKKLFLGYIQIMDGNSSPKYAIAGGQVEKEPEDIDSRFRIGDFIVPVINQGGEMGEVKNIGETATIETQEPQDLTEIPIPANLSLPPTTTPTEIITHIQSKPISVKKYQMMEYEEDPVGAAEKFRERAKTLEIEKAITHAEEVNLEEQNKRINLGLGAPRTPMKKKGQK